MPDLSIEIVQICSDLDPNAQEWHIGGYTQYQRSGEYFCTCKGFQFRKTCKHLVELANTRCDWHGMFSDEVQTPAQETQHICPKCGKNTILIRMGV